MSERYTIEGTREAANLDKSQTYTVLGDVYWWNDPSNSWMSDTCPFMINHERMEYYVMKTKQADGDLVAEKDAEIERLRKAVADALAWFSDPDTDVVEQFERIAEEFYRETGHLRPGKSYPMGLLPPDDLDSIWSEWTYMRQRSVLKGLRDAAYLRERGSRPPTGGEA